MNCPNCGAVLVDNKCEYCGYENIEKKVNHDVHVYHHNSNYISKEDKPQKKINIGILVLLWFFFFPIMIFYTIWQSKKLSFKTKVIITVIIAAFFITLGYINDNDNEYTHESSQNRNSIGEKFDNQDWCIEIYDINFDYDIDNQEVLLIDLEFEYIGGYAFEVSPSDLEFTLKNTDDFIFFENKYYGKKDLDIELETQDKYIGTIAFNIEPETDSDYILKITSSDYERECDIELVIEKYKVIDAYDNLNESK